MKVRVKTGKKIRIEMLPLIDIVFLLLVFFIYAMLSMAVHRGLPVHLPVSSTAGADRNPAISLTVRADGAVYLEKQRMPLKALTAALKRRAESGRNAGVLLFADRTLPYQRLFQVLDQVRRAGLTRISLQAEMDK